MIGVHICIKGEALPGFSQFPIATIIRPVLYSMSVRSGNFSALKRWVHSIRPEGRSLFAKASH